MTFKVIPVETNVSNKPKPNSNYWKFVFCDLSDKEIEFLQNLINKDKVLLTIDDSISKED